MSGKENKEENAREEVSNGNKKNGVRQSNGTSTRTTDKKTNQDSKDKQENDENPKGEPSDQHENDGKRDTNRNDDQEESGKSKIDKRTKQKNGDSNGKQRKEKKGSKSKMSKSKQEKSSSATFDDEVQPSSSQQSVGQPSVPEDVDGVLKEKLVNVRQKKPIDFGRYRDQDEITEGEWSVIDELQSAATREERDELLQKEQENVYTSIAKILNCVHKDEEKKQLLVLVHDILAEDMDRAEQMNEAAPDMKQSFQGLLNDKDDLTQHIASQVLAKLLLAHNGREDVEEIKGFLDFINHGLDEYNPYLQSVTRCLQRLLQVDEYRMCLEEMGGMRKIVTLLTRNLKMQVQYQLCFCMWVSTFNADLAEKLSSTNLIPIVMNLLETCPAEIIKLPRVALALIRNLLEKPKSDQTRRRHALLAIQCQLSEYLKLLEPRVKDINDPEFGEDFEEIQKILTETKASSFDEYMTEVKSGRLAWGVVHTSRKFWTSNAKKLNENDHELLKMLITFLENRDDANVLVIVCHDLGEYMIEGGKGGKAMVESLGGKDALFRLLEHPNGTVKYQALMCLQMLMLDKSDVFRDKMAKKSRSSEVW